MCRAPTARHYQQVNLLGFFKRMHNMTEALSRNGPSLGKDSASQEQLIRSLDGLLERYLHLLDQYQTLQQELTKHLSAVGTHHIVPPDEP